MFGGVVVPLVGVCKAEKLIRSFMKSLGPHEAPLKFNVGHPQRTPAPNPPLFPATVKYFIGNVPVGNVVKRFWTNAVLAAFVELSEVACVVVVNCNICVVFPAGVETIMLFVPSFTNPTVMGPKYISVLKVAILLNTLAPATVTLFSVSVNA